MTTIAIDRHEIAADGQRTWGGEYRGMDFEKIKIVDGVVYAYTGLTPLFGPMIEWHRRGANPEDLPKCSGDDGWTLIVIDRPGVVSKYTVTCPYREDFALDDPIAFGAGCDYAMGAMWHGATPTQAVMHVARHLNHTGGKIIAIALPLPIGQQMPEAAE